MIGLVICTHSNLAEAILTSAEMIVGSIPSSAAVGVHPGDSPEDIHSRLSEALTEVDQGDGVIVLCDMFGGTPSNISLTFLSPTIDVVTGVNLPMVLKFFTTREGPVADVSSAIQLHARDNILAAGVLMGTATEG
ncbi:MAG: PTS sugar transporter subunit IIA [Bradymonadia bacterium]